MLLLDVGTRNFRNLEDPRVALAPHTTVLFGPNGQGKTNFLEACYLASTLRPLRAQKLIELVRLGSGQSALVQGRFELPGGIRDIEVEVGREGRSARLDGKPLREAGDLFGGLATVAFTPDDLAVVKGGPEGRRRLLDRAVQNRYPAHLGDARDYLRALRSRNQLLRQGAQEALLESFDGPLVRLGVRLRTRREEVLAEILPHAEKAFAEVARGEAALGLAYLAAGRDSDHLETGGAGLEERLLEALHRRLPRDRERGYTSVGPHADDLGLALGDRPARLYASQGQARAVVLAFKIGEIENLRRVQGRAPLLLLDDVSSELDPARNAFLMQYLAALQGQVVLTTTDPDLVARSAPGGAVFQRVEGGRITPENLLFSE
ncbi:MAG TPA: DNA replication/repair protein RecF [Myxococcales bacterium]|nr:DNA replication/repair protein RecF [Myxococcales bacterium]